MKSDSIYRHYTKHLLSRQHNKVKVYKDGVSHHNLYDLFHTLTINNLKEQKFKEEEEEFVLPPFSPSFSHNLPLLSNRQRFVFAGLTV